MGDLRRGARRGLCSSGRPMHADICASHAALDQSRRGGRPGERELRVSSVQLRRRRADERERNRVPSRIAALQVGTSAVGVSGQLLMAMGCQPVMMFRMIVVVVHVNMQRGHDAGRRYQSREEQQREDAVHSDESMKRRGTGQRPGAPGETCRRSRCSCGAPRWSWSSQPPCGPALAKSRSSRTLRSAR